MKKKAILAVGLCLAVGFTSIGLSACGDKGGPSGGGEGEKSSYYLAGKSLGGLFGDTWNEETQTGGDWYSGYMTPAEIPDALAFKNTSEANVYKITVDLYKGDNFGVLTAGKGWDGQMGGKTGDTRCELDPYTADKTAQLYGAPGGGTTENIAVGVAGNYTLTLTVDTANANNNKITYVRNGDPTVAIHVDYNYWIKGDKVSGGQEMRVDYTQFTANDAKDTYELTIGMQADDKFTFIDEMIEDATAKKEIKSDSLTIATDADTTAAIEKADAANAENPTGKLKVKGGTGTYKFTLTEDAENNLTLAAKKTAEEVPQYDFYLKSNMNGDTRMQKRDKQLTLNATTGLYEIELQMNKSTVDASQQTLTDVASAFELSVVPHPSTAYADEAAIREAEKFAITTAYKDSYVSNQLSTSTGSWKCTATTTDTFTITIDPVSMMVRAVGENDTQYYGVAVHGNMLDPNWGTVVATDQIAPSSTDGKYRGAVVLKFEDGDAKLSTYEFGLKSYNYYDQGNQIGWFNEATTVTNNVDTKITQASAGANFKVAAAGTYEFSFVLNDEGHFESVTINEGEGLGIAAKGPATEGGWDKATALTTTATYAVDGTYTIQTSATLGTGDFGLYSYKFYDPNVAQLKGGWGGKTADGESTIKDDYALDVSAVADKIDTTGGDLVVKAGQGGTYYFTCVLDAAGQFKSLTISATAPAAE